MKSIFRSGRRLPHQHIEEAQQDNAAPFFDKKGDRPRSPFFTHGGGAVQAKLAIGQPGDPYEREADAVADSVVQNQGKGAAPAIQGKGISRIQRVLTAADSDAATADERMEEDKLVQEKPEIQREAMPEEEEPVQMMEMPEEDELQAKAEPGGAATAGPHLSSRIQHKAGKGRPLPGKARAEMEQSFGADFSGVNIHTDTEAMHMNKELGAQAFTHGQDVYFNSGKFSPETTEGKRLLAHELTHVVQQGEGIQPQLIQRDLAQSLPTSNGVFNIDMVTREDLLLPPPVPAGARSGLRGTIEFEPSATAPYSNEIALIQIVKLTDSGSGADVDSGTMVPGRNVRTTEDTDRSIEGGFLTDVEHRRGGVNAEPGSNLSAHYPFGPAGSPGGRQVRGFNRSNDPADIRPAELFDFPSTTSTAHNLDFQFETVARGDDTMTNYGSLEWGFGIRAGDVVNEYVNVSDGPSPTFEEAMELHRDFYVHEPVIFYFGFDQDFLQPDELAKIDTFLDYLSRFPDVRLSLAGYADRRGNPDYNLGLSLRRAENVKQALLDKGIAENRVDEIILGFGSTEEFTSGDLAPNPGQGQDIESNRRGNRRVVLTFEHTQSFPGP